MTCMTQTTNSTFDTKLQPSDQMLQTHPGRMNSPRLPDRCMAEFAEGANQYLKKGDASHHERSTINKAFRMNSGDRDSQKRQKHGDAHKFPTIVFNFEPNVRVSQINRAKLGALAWGNQIYIKTIVCRTHAAANGCRVGSGNRQHDTFNPPPRGDIAAFPARRLEHLKEENAPHHKRNNWNNSLQQSKFD